MKILISGPPNSGKSKIIKELRSNKWIIDKKYKFIPNDIDIPQVDGDISHSENSIFNNQIQKIFNSLDNSVFCGSIYDTYAYILKYSMKGYFPTGVLEEYVAKVPYFLNMFDIVFVLGKKDSDMNEFYEKAKFLLTGDKKCVYLDEDGFKNTYSTIFNKIVEKEEAIRLEKEKQSTLYFTPSA